MAASTSLPLFPQLAEMSDEEKYAIIARFIPCDLCSTCTGWHPASFDEANCHCGHDTYHHIDNGQDLDRRLKVAIRLNELLEEKGKIEDYDYEDEDITSLKKQIFFNATDASSVPHQEVQDLKRSREENHDDEEEEEEEHHVKRNRTEAEEFQSEEEEEEEKEEEEEEEDEEDEEEDEEDSEEEESEKEEADSDSSEQEDDEEEEAEAHPTIDDNVNNTKPNSTSINDNHAKEEEGEENETLPTVTEVRDNTLTPNETDQPQKSENEDDEDTKELKQENDHESNITNGVLEDVHIKESSVPDLVPSEDEVMNGVEEEQEVEDEVSRMIKEFMPLEKKESPAMIEEREGDIRTEVVLNDGARESMILLTGLKNIFQKQLPKMPKEYIARLVYDRNHRSIALIRNPKKVIGGICYRPFDDQEFAEIVFCAVASTEQVKGYGSFIMNHLKDYVSGYTNVKHFLTYADNYAVGYFKKQGFTTEITLDKRKWVGYIKDYEGGTIMQCTMVPQVKYLQVQDILGVQRNAILKKIQDKSTEHITFPGLRMPLNKNGKRSIDPLEVPGIADSGWTPEMDILSNRPRHSPHYNTMLHIVEEMQNYTHAWPFLEPVSIEDVADYYDIIKDPMDLATLEENVKADAYPTMDDFVKDTQKIFENCKLYNAEDTEYARCAAKLERFFNEKLRAATRASAAAAAANNNNNNTNH